MMSKKIIARQGLTLIEVMIAVVLAVIVVFGVGTMLVDSQRGWHTMYNRIYSDVMTGGYVARKAFDGVVRKATRQKYSLADDGTWIEVYYYADANSVSIDRYARFYYDPNVGGSGQLNVEYGALNPRETLDTETICQDVTSCIFTGTGRSAQMFLTLDNGTQTNTIVTSSVMHN
jgi:hypothetical protein